MASTFIEQTSSATDKGSKSKGNSTNGHRSVMATDSSAGDSLVPPRHLRNRLLSDSSEELPRSILKNPTRIPTKRSVSECVDDLAYVMADLDLNIKDLPQSKGKFCPHHRLRLFDRVEEIDSEREEDEDDYDEGDDESNDDDKVDFSDEGVNSDASETSLSNRNDQNNNNREKDETKKGEENSKENRNGDQPKKRNNRNKSLNNKTSSSSQPARKLNKKCDCKFELSGDSNIEHQIQQQIGNNYRKLSSASEGDDEKPKKCVRFDERVYEMVFFASRLYDRRYFAKFRFSSRHHPQPSNQHSKSKKNACKQHAQTNNGNQQVVKPQRNGACKQTKSQRAKQSRRDKKKSLHKRDEVMETSSDDQGYCSSIHSTTD